VDETQTLGNSAQQSTNSLGTVFVAMLKRIGILLFLVISFVFFSQEQNAFAQQQSENEVYSKIKPFSIPDLKAFLVAFPDSKSRDSVNEAITLLSTLDDIRSGKVKPKLVIPFTALGHWSDGSSVWENYRQVSPDREAAGWFCKTNGMAGIFNPLAGAGHGISVGNNGRPLWPTGDGSIWGVDSSDLVTWFPGIKVRTQGRLKFGVISDKGLVYLSGSGTIVFVDGGNKEVDIK
jgi:hypothetical protein